MQTRSRPWSLRGRRDDVRRSGVARYHVPMSKCHHSGAKLKIEKTKSLTWRWAVAAATSTIAMSHLFILSNTFLRLFQKIRNWMLCCYITECVGGTSDVWTERRAGLYIGGRSWYEVGSEEEERKSGGDDTGTARWTCVKWSRQWTKGKVSPVTSSDSSLSADKHRNTQEQHLLPRGWCQRREGVRLYILPFGSPVISQRVAADQQPKRRDPLALFESPIRRPSLSVFSMKAKKERKCFHKFNAH